MTVMQWEHPAATGARDDNTYGFNNAGTFVPGPAMWPTTLAGMSGVTAFPATAWTTGKYVTLANGAKVHWNGTAWAAGPA